MKKFIPLILTFFIIASCVKEVKEPLLTQSEVLLKHPSINFWEVDVLEERQYKGSYDAEADVIYSVDEDSEVISPVNYILNLSEEVVIISTKDGKVLNEFKVLERSYEGGFYLYWMEKGKEKYKLSHQIEKDGTFSYFTLRNTDSFTEYLTRRYDN